MKTFLFAVAILTGSLVSLSRAADLTQFKSADDLWSHIEKLKQGPAEKPSSKEEANRIIPAWLKELDAAAEHFIKTHAADARQWEARMLRVQLSLSPFDGEPNAATLAAADQSLQEIAEATAAADPLREGAKILRIRLHADALGETPTKEGVEKVDQEIVDFVKASKNQRANQFLQSMRVELHDQLPDAEAEASLQKFAAEEDPLLAGPAKQLLEKRKLMKNPIDLKFTSVTGEKVDLEKLRGKVVLLDFWATWCGPCRIEMPNVVATYEKLNPKGFEIVGISLDEDKDALLAFTKEYKMPWPQYFDGKGWQNEISTRFGVEAIPAMWVLDKKGIVRSTEVRGPELGKLVEKLLAE